MRGRFTTMRTESSATEHFRPVLPSGARLPGALAILTLAVLLCLPAHTQAADWTEPELNRALVKIERQMERGRWDRVIKEGEQALPHCIRLKGEASPACITLLNKLNHSRFHTGHFLDNRANIEKAYSLAKSTLGTNHFTTALTRELYYRLLLTEERYQPAITVVQEIIASEKARNNDPFEIMERTRQLYALYGLTGQLAEEEATLRTLLDMTARLMGRESPKYDEVAQALAENLCSRKMYYEYFEFVNAQEGDVGVECRLRP